MSQIEAMNEAGLDSTNPLHIVVAQSGIDTESALSIEGNFAPLFRQAQEWAEKVKMINVTDASQVREMKLAKETRLALREIRVNADKIRAKLKADSLRRGQAIDGMYKVVAFLVEPLEERLLEQEKFVERKEAARKEVLSAERTRELQSLGVDTTGFSLGEMNEGGYAALLENTKIAHAAKIEAARKAEQEIIERKTKEREEREKVAAENARLRKEAQEQEEARRQERLKEQALREVERQKAQTEREAIEDKARKEREQIEEAARKERELARAQAEKERLLREQAEQELAAQRKQEEDRKKEAKLAAKRAAAAGDSEKIIAYAKIVRESLPHLKDPESLQLVGIQAAKFVTWLEYKASTL